VHAQDIFVRGRLGRDDVRGLGDMLRESRTILNFCDWNTCSPKRKS
jgi:hypothetical protein